MFSFLVCVSLHADNSMQQTIAPMSPGMVAAIQDNIIKIQTTIDDLKRELAGIDLKKCVGLSATDPKKSDCVKLQGREAALRTEIQQNENQLKQLKNQIGVQLPFDVRNIQQLPGTLPANLPAGGSPKNTGIVSPNISMPGTPSSVQSLVLPQSPVLPSPVAPLQPGEPVGGHIMEAQRRFEGGAGQPQPGGQLPPPQQERIERPLVSAGSEPTPNFPAITPAQQGAITMTPIMTQPVMTQQGVVQQGTPAPMATMPMQGLPPVQPGIPDNNPPINMPIVPLPGQ